MTTGMERLAAIQRGQVADRIPVFCNLLDQGAAELGLDLEAYYASGEAVAEGQVRMRQKYGYDNVWSLFYVGREVELLGCRKICFSPFGPPNVEHLVIQSAEDIRRLVVPEDLASHPGFAENLKCLRLLRAAVGGRHPICAYITGSMTLPVMLMGMEKWLDLLFCGPADVRDLLLCKCSDFCQKQLAAYRQAGVDVLLYSQPFGSPEILPMRLIRELTLPWMARDLQPGGVAGVVYYCGSSIMNPVIEPVLQRFGITGYYLSPMDDVVTAQRIVADRGVVAGVINDIQLIDWTPAEVQREVARMLAAGMPGGRFLFGTLVMPLAIPEANIRAMLEAVYTWSG